MSKSKLGLVVGLVALAVPLFGATSAQAEETITASCVFNGATGNIDPNEAPSGVPVADDPDPDPTPDAVPDAGVQSIVNDVQDQDGVPGNPANDWDGGGYTFSTAATPTGRTTCTVDSSNPAEDGVFDGEISSKGHYNNRVCGTGTAIDDDVPPPPLPGEETTVTANPGGETPPGAIPTNIIDADYTLDFEAGNGPLDITNVDSTANATNDGVAERDDTPGNTPPEAGNRPDVDGEVNIVPAPGQGNCVTADGDVRQFLASGEFTATWTEPVVD